MKKLIFVLFPVFLSVSLVLPLLKFFPKKAVLVPNDVPTLAEAYAKVPPNGKITLRHGTHSVPETIVITKNVTILGDPAHPERVVLQGGESSVFHLQSGFAEIAGVTIQNEGQEGNEEDSNIAVLFSAPQGLFHDCVFTSRFGGGFAVNAKDSRPLVRNCVAQNCGLTGFFIGSEACGTFRNCTARGNEYSGLQVRDEGSNPTVEGCEFTDGKATGILVALGAAGTFRNCTASRNVFAGMQVRDEGSNPTVEDCEFTDGKDAGIFIYSGAAGTFRKCKVSGNESAGMGVRDEGSNPTVEDCEFTDGKEVGIAVLLGACGTFRNCTVNGNAKEGMEVGDEGSNPTVTGCKFTNGKAPGIFVHSGAAGTFRNAPPAETNLREWRRLPKGAVPPWKTACSRTIYAVFGFRFRVRHVPKEPFFRKYA